MISRITDWWRTRQVIRLGKVEVEKFNAELNECRRALVSIADESVEGLKVELISLKSDPQFSLDLCRETWQFWHDDGEELVEETRGAVHLRMQNFLEFAQILEIESEMNSTIDKAVDEWKAYFLLSGADAYASFAKNEGLAPEE